MTFFVRTRFYPLACMTLLCTAASPSWAGTLEGTAYYRERIALPPDAMFEAQLQDISRADVPAVVLGRARLEPAGQPPFRFKISYDEAAVDPRGRYAVRATVAQAGKLLFTMDTIHSPFDARNAPLQLLLVSAGRGPQAAPEALALGALPASFEGELPGADNSIRWHVDLFPEGRFQLRTTHVGQPAPNQYDDIGRWWQEAGSGRVVLSGGREAPVFLLPVHSGGAVRKLDLQGKPIESAHNDRLERQPTFAPIEPRLLLAGLFVSVADAANIVLCADNRSVPVSMDADYKALEAAYLKARAKPGERLLVSLEGLLTFRPSMELTQPPRATLVVERFVGVWPGQRCPAMPDPSAQGPK